jgi:hypothetical protein
MLFIETFLSPNSNGMVFVCLVVKETQNDHGGARMYRFQKGYFSRQTGLLLTLLALGLAFAVPKINEVTTKSKMAEAYHLANESKLRLAEFYMLSGRLPSTELEKNSILSSIFTQPEFVDSIAVESKDQDYDVAVRVYLKADVVDNDSGEPQFIYLAANRPESASQGLEWRCGASGVDAELLPNACTG